MKMHRTVADLFIADPPWQLAKTVYYNVCGLACMPGLTSFNSHVKRSVRL